MRTVLVSSDSLGYFLLLEPALEPEPEVFRLQPNVTFVLAFDKYLDFITYYLNSVDFLATPTKELHTLLREYRLGGSERAKQELFQAFLKDVACAVVKELCFAEAYGKGASNITHSIADGVIMSNRDIDEIFVNVENVGTANLHARLSHKGYALPKKISGQNARLWKYAVVSQFLALSAPFYWSYDNN